jgi:ATP-dependent Clp protease adapter protein ClpS
MVPSLRFIITCLIVGLLPFSTSFSPAVGTITRPSRSQNTLLIIGAGPSTIERETVRIGRGPAILESPTSETIVRRKVDEPVKEGKGMGNESWEVRIYNDGLNTREHVARCLVQVTGISEFMAYKTMMHAHQHGMAVVGRYVYEIAELYHDQLKTNGLVCDIVPVEDA